MNKTVFYILMDFGFTSGVRVTWFLASDRKGAEFSLHPSVERTSTQRTSSTCARNRLTLQRQKDGCQWLWASSKVHVEAHQQSLWKKTFILVSPQPTSDQFRQTVLTCRYSLLLGTAWLTLVLLMPNCSQTFSKLQTQGKLCPSYSHHKNPGK